MRPQSGRRIEAEMEDTHPLPKNLRYPTRLLRTKRDVLPLLRMQLQELADGALVAAGSLSLAGLLARVCRVGGEGDGVARVEVHGAVPVLGIAAITEFRHKREVGMKRSTYWVAMLDDACYPGAGSASEYSSLKLEGVYCDGTTQGGGWIGGEMGQRVR